MFRVVRNQQLFVSYHRTECPLPRVTATYDLGMTCAGSQKKEPRFPSIKKRPPLFFRGSFQRNDSPRPQFTGLKFKNDAHYGDGRSETRQYITASTAQTSKSKDGDPQVPPTPHLSS